MRESLLSYTQELLDRDLPFLLLRQQGESRVKIISQNSQMLHKTATDKMAYAVFSKFLSTQDQIIINGDVIKEFTWSEQSIVLKQDTLHLQNNDQKHYEKLVRDAVDKIKNSDLSKVVLSRKKVIEKEIDPIKILARLLDNYPDAHCYFFHHPAIGTWMGATPEILLSYKNGFIKTMSLAGTISAVDQQIPLWSIKENEEQELVTQFIVSQLRQVTNSIEIGAVETVQAGKLYHLKTDIKAAISKHELENALKLLHPTPAVCGVPRDVALRFIKDHEDYDRSFYTGYLGIVDLDEESADYYVNLRCMQWTKQDITLYAGGGITALSDPQSEYEETENKLQTMSRLLFEAQ